MSRKTDAVVARTIGIDTGKNTLHLIGLDDRGAIVLREKLTRGRIATRLANVPQCLIGIEAGMATHCVARELIALGHDVKQVPPVYAKPFRQGYKNDFRDAHAIAEIRKLHRFIDGLVVVNALDDFLTRPKSADHGRRQKCDMWPFAAPCFRREYRNSQLPTPDQGSRR